MFMNIQSPVGEPLHAGGEGGDEGDVLTKGRHEPVGGRHHPQLLSIDIVDIIEQIYGLEHLVDCDVGKGAACAEYDGARNHRRLQERRLEM